MTVNPVTTILISVVIVLAIGVPVIVWLRRRGRSSIDDALAAIAIRSVHDVVVPDGMGGEIHIEHLLLTSKGILVIDVKRYEGVVFASERMDEWSAIGREGRSAFQNPLPNLYNRVAAVRQIVRDIEVRGLLVFPPKADFSKGCPKDVMLPADLLEHYSKPERGELGRVTEAFEPYWETIQNGVRSATS